MTIPTSDRSLLLLLWFDRDRHLGDVGAARDVHHFDDTAVLDAVVGIDDHQQIGILGDLLRSSDSPSSRFIDRLFVEKNLVLLCDA